MRIPNTSHPSDTNVSRLVSGRYPEPGTNPIADTIEARLEDSQGLNLLQAPRC